MRQAPSRIEYSEWTCRWTKVVGQGTAHSRMRPQDAIGFGQRAKLQLTGPSGESERCGQLIRHPAWGRGGRSLFGSSRRSDPGLPAGSSHDRTGTNPRASRRRRRIRRAGHANTGISPSGTRRRARTLRRRAGRSPRRTRREPARLRRLRSRPECGRGDPCKTGRTSAAVGNRRLRRRSHPRQGARRRPSSGPARSARSEESIGSARHRRRTTGRGEIAVAARAAGCRRRASQRRGGRVRSRTRHQKRKS